MSERCYHGATSRPTMKDRSDDPSYHERTLLPRSYISLPVAREDQILKFQIRVMSSHGDLYVSYKTDFITNNSETIIGKTTPNHFPQATLLAFEDKYRIFQPIHLGSTHLSHIINQLKENLLLLSIEISGRFRTALFGQYLPIQTNSASPSTINWYRTLNTLTANLFA